MMSPRQRRYKFFLLLVSYVGIFLEEEGRCSIVEVSISLSENQSLSNQKENHANPSEQHLYTQKQILAPNAGKRVVNPLEASVKI